MDTPASDEHRRALRNIDGHPPVADKQRWLGESGCDGRVVRVGRWHDVGGGMGMSLTYGLKRTGEINPPCTTPATSGGSIRL